MTYVIKRRFKYLAYANNEKGTYYSKKFLTLRKGEFIAMKYENLETAKAVAKRYKGRVVKL